MKTNKTIIYAITKKDVYLFFFYDLFIATLAYYMFKIKPTMFYECLGITGSILCPLLMKSGDRGHFLIKSILFLFNFT